MSSTESFRWFRDDDQIYTLDDLVRRNEIYSRLREVFQNCLGIINNFQDITPSLRGAVSDDDPVRELYQALLFLTCLNLHSMVAVVRLANEGFCLECHILTRTMYERLLSARLICRPPSITRAQRFLRHERVWLERKQRQSKDSRTAVHLRSAEDWGPLITAVAADYMRKFHATKDPKRLPKHWHGLERMEDVAVLAGMKNVHDWSWEFRSEIVHSTGFTALKREGVGEDIVSHLEVNLGDVRLCLGAASCHFLDTWVALSQYFPIACGDRATSLRENHKRIIAGMSDPWGESI